MSINEITRYGHDLNPWRDVTNMLQEIGGVWRSIKRSFYFIFCLVGRPSFTLLLQGYDHNADYNIGLLVFGSFLHGRMRNLLCHSVPFFDAPNTILLLPVYV